MPKPIKLVEGIGNGGNGALIQSSVILWTNDQHFILLQSIGVYGKPSPLLPLTRGGLIFTSECTESRKPFGNRSLCNRL